MTSAVMPSQARTLSTHDLAVIIVSYNVRDLLRACLTATFASLDLSPELNATVWVVDNASGDGSAEMVSDEFPSVRLTRNAENVGFTHIVCGDENSRAEFRP